MTAVPARRADLTTLDDKRRAALDLLDDILGDRADKVQRLAVLREIEREAKRMANGMARSMMADWLVHQSEN